MHQGRDALFFCADFALTPGRTLYGKYAAARIITQKSEVIAAQFEKRLTAYVGNAAVYLPDLFKYVCR